MNRWIFLALLATSLALPAQAKLGGNIKDYQMKTKESLRLEAQNKRGQTTDYNFNYLTVPRQEHLAPGYSMAVTISVNKNKIVGQTLAVHFGKSPESGKTLSVVHAMDFSFEALGKAPPSNKSSLNTEVAAYKKVVFAAVLGNPQIIRYPGYDGKLTFKRAGGFDLIVAATPEVHEETKPAETAPSPTP